MHTTVYMTPTPTHARRDLSNSINQIVVRLQGLLPQFGVELTENPDAADVVACHAGMSDRKVADVAHISGLYPTAHFPQYDWHWAANDFVLENVRRARLVTVPSQWVADLFRRDMHLDPAVVQWGIDINEWQPGADGGYVLWNKTRVDGVCDPTPLIKLAQLAPGHKFVSTFGEMATNVSLTGRLEYEKMKPLIRNAAVYLGTTLETFGIGTLEAMACGVPVLGFSWGGTKDIVEHGVTGYLVQPGDYEGLLEGLEYCLKHRATLGANAREVAKAYTWEKTAEELAVYYVGVKMQKYAKTIDTTAAKVAVIIPCHNYERYVGDAIRSVAAQQTTFNYRIIVVNDGSTDNSARVARETIAELGLTNAQVISHVNQGVAHTRNRGIRETDAEYIVCLDADDMIGDPTFLQVCADKLDERRDLGIVYTKLQVIDENGVLSQQDSNWPDDEHNYDVHVRGRNQIPTLCMFRREAWARAGGYRQRYAPAEDAELWLRIGAIGYRAELVSNRKMFFYRMHSNSLSSAIREGRRTEPDWRSDKRWIESGNRPFAADGRPPRMSWPVHHYMLPTISVIIPLGPGHEDKLKDAIDSVESQTYPYWELIIVVDDGKPDDSDGIDLTYAPYARVFYASSLYEITPIGAGAAR